MMRRLLAVVLSLAAGEVAAQETSFLLINGTAYPISQLAVSETDFNFWTPNVLHPPPTTYCQADLQVGFADGGQPAVWRNLNLCTLSRIKLVYDRMTGMTTASYDD
jgi:hypothetical protein